MGTLPIAVECVVQWVGLGEDWVLHGKPDIEWMAEGPSAAFIGLIGQALQQ